MRPLLALDGVAVSLGDRPVLRDFDLRIGPDERVAIMGPNGVGKSTLLDIMLGLRPVDRGDVDVLGSRPPNRRVGFVPQDPGASLLPWFTVRQNVLLPLDARGVSRDEAEAALERARSQLDPEHTLNLDARPSRLSGGERQRAALMRGVIGQPSLLICDEPFSAIDAPSRARARAALRAVCEAKDGPGLVIVTHDSATALSLATRVVLLSGQPATISFDIDTATEDAAAQLAAGLAAR